MGNPDSDTVHMKTPATGLASPLLATGWEDPSQGGIQGLSSPLLAIAYPLLAPGWEDPKQRGIQGITVTGID